MLTAGTQLGPYEILGAIGAGGMGEVYRARDTYLGRDVAIKVLPDLFANDPERLARFKHEAQLLASLNHPNIAHIHGLEQSSGTSALVMELVEGEDLAQRLQRGTLPLDEALPIARQIAEALEAAHEKGIVHRDLKPANIKVRTDGAVKVLDFGLAKAMDLVSSPAADSALANLSTGIGRPPPTVAGTILGTAAYMSPEQARGKPVDRRTDIWAFGCVVYELLAGRRAFAGQETADLIVAVLTTEPDWTALPPATPLRIVELLKRCLKKGLRERLHDIADGRLEIEEAIAHGYVAVGGESLATPAPRARVSRLQRVAWTGVGAALAALGAVGLGVTGVWPRTGPPDTRPLRVSIVHTEGGDVSSPAISPDGRRVAYAARRSDGMPLLWIRDLASGEERSLAGTEEAYVPFWSPDARDLAFSQGGVLKRVSADGGPVQIVSDRQAGPGGAWAADDTILFNGGDLNPLFRVSAAGGQATPATTLQGADWSHHWPSFLPDGRRFLFTAKLWTRASEASQQGIYLGSLDSPEIQRVLPDLSSAVYAPPGTVVFARDGILTAAPFDLSSGRVTGTPAPIGGTVAIDDSSYLSGFSAANDGTLAVRPPPAVALVGGSGAPAFNAQLHLVDRAGTGSGLGPAQRFSYSMALNPDGRRVAAAIVDPRTSTQDIWLIDLQSGSRTALTTTQGFAFRPVWSADGTRLAYAYQPPGRLDDVYIKDLPTGQVTSVVEGQAYEDPLAWSHDGAHLIVYRVDMSDAKQPYGHWVWSFASRTLTRFVESGSEGAAFSPDDRYVAFTSSASGRTEVSVTTFPERRQTWLLTTEGGQVLSWRADGREILVATMSGHIVGYPVTTADGFAAGQPAVLVRGVGSAARFSTATRDHSRILIRVSPDVLKDKGEMRLLFGWADAWRQGKPLTRP